MADDLQGVVEEWNLSPKVAGITTDNREVGHGVLEWSVSSLYSNKQRTIPHMRATNHGKTLKLGAGR